MDWPSGLDATAAAERLATAGLTQSPRALALYLRVVRPDLDFEPGPHLLNDALSPRQLVQRLARVPGRQAARVVVPEGFNSLQIAERLQKHQVCGAAAFRRSLSDEPLLRELGIAAPSAEGFLFPATYDFAVDSSPAAVIRTMVRHMRRRLELLGAKHQAALQRLKRERGWGERELLTLASIVEKEAAAPDERRLIASVFYNRLSDPAFRPLRSLQSDPTAAYGCLVAPEAAPSCAGFRGQVTPGMLKDAGNRYNTYRHPGLPPGPIASPGEGAIESVLDPAQSDYLFFVARGGGRHAFSRTYGEHTEAVRRRREQVGALDADP